MRLKSLEIKGFKSFANETIINFNENVIGIVGPNGAGKSNVVDAIRWVLGEQKSKELRLDKMSNIIFNGTKKRKESGMAQVTLTFENTQNLIPLDYNFISISRILYRTGESEYRLNNVPCRLKDINTLFLDTGIGSNSYAIIALGMVDDILNDKENARRKMFEQAAGISKYKTRKQETLSKLESATADLDRVEDLLHEIDTNVKILEKQAKRTQKYFDLKAQYRELSIELAIFQLSSHKIQYKNIEEKLQLETDKNRNVTTEILKNESILEAEKKANLDKEQTLSTRQRDLNALVGRIRGLENEQNIILQRKSFIAQSKIKLEEQVKTAKIRTSNLGQDISEFRAQLVDEKKLEIALENQLEKSENDLKNTRAKHSNLKEGLDVFVTELRKIEVQIAETDKKKAVQNNQIENLQSDLARNADNMQARLNEANGLIEQLKTTQVIENELIALIGGLENEEKSRVELMEFTNQQLDVHRVEVAKVRRELDANRNEYKLTKSMVDNLEGFSESIKYLSKEKNWSQNPVLLSDLLFCKEEYRVAIENFLEPYLSYFVVESKEEAEAAIELLKTSQKGRVNLFILDFIKKINVTKNINKLDLIAATAVVEVEEKYINLCNLLLQNVYISENEDVRSSSPEGLTILAKAGNFIHRPESVSGGSVGLFDGKKIGRKKNLHLIEKNIQTLEKTEQQLSEEINKLQIQLTALKNSNKQAVVQKEKNQLNRLLQEMIGLQTKIENIENFKKEVKEKNQNTENFIKKLLLENDALNIVLENYRHQAREIASNLTAADSSYKELAEELGKASATFNEQNVLFIRQQNKVSTIQRELNFREKQLEETKFNLEKEQNLIQSSNKDLEAAEAEILELNKNLTNYLSDKKEKTLALNDAEQSYFQARGKMNELEDNIKKWNRQRNENQVLLENLKDKFSDIKLQLSAIGERLKIEFNIAINDLFNREPNKDYIQSDLQDHVTKIKNKLENYGEINPMAVETYKEMSERLTTIAAQKNDILEAKNSLIETIKEIELTATQQFISAFDQIRNNFIEVFRSLFTDDDACDLVLENPAEPLESPINIVAKPKGKRPQSISQLSGGEKTLTATALLFALYLLKPAPFCIFDEVDAPLDDANIEKFNRIIKKFSADSQFIIVTHNKQTMAAVDVIYGVYMPEQGVSGVSAVDFRTLESENSVLQVMN